MMLGHAVRANARLYREKATVALQHMQVEAVVGRGSARACGRDFNPLQLNDTRLQVRYSVRIEAPSAFARDFKLPSCAEGHVCDRYERDSISIVGVWIEGVGYCSGVPRAEVEAMSSDG